jgi:halocyanin-like protein
MTESNGDLSRRAFMRTAAGATTAAAATGTASAASGNESGGGGNESSGGGGGGGGPPDFGGYLDGANNYDGSVADQRGQSEVNVAVGAGDGLAFGPAAVHIDNGATIVWEWTGEGGAHNVVSEDEVFNSGSPTTSGTFEYTFEEDGIYPYFCVPHKGAGMLGAVVVGSDYPTRSTGGGGESAGPSDLPGSAKTLGVATLVVAGTTLGMAYFFMKYGGDYGEFEED